MSPRITVLYKNTHFAMQWEEILPKVNLGPSSRHLFKIPQTSRVNYVKLNMFPDGGIVSPYRRVYVVLAYLRLWHTGEAQGLWSRKPSVPIRPLRRL